MVRFATELRGRAGLLCSVSLRDVKLGFHADRLPSGPVKGPVCAGSVNRGPAGLVSCLADWGPGYGPALSVRAERP